MSCSLSSFSTDFWGDPNSGKPAHEPRTIYEAIAAIPEEELVRLAEEVFQARAVSEETIALRIQETDTVTRLTPPVEVWIDPDGYFTVKVWDKRE